ncbi:MAG TPA: GEVED domain-containing protein, partial [Saprospiraceae bacterium]|nr:GEVED domain-containing protein [Saprospiraceae bacterium]
MKHSMKERTYTLGHSFSVYLNSAVAYLGFTIFAVLVFAACQQAETEVQMILTPHSKTVQAKGYDLELKPDGIKLNSSSSGWKMNFPEVNVSPAFVTDRGREELLYSEVAPGVDVRIYDKGKGLAGYDFILAPGADVADAQFHLEGAERAYLSEQGELVLPAKKEEIRHSRPHSFQIIDGVKKVVRSNFVLEDNVLGFDLGEYDDAYPVIIDPTIYAVLAEIPADVLLFINQTVSPNASTGTVITYNIAYSAISSVANPQNAQIRVPLPLLDGISATAIGTDVISSAIDGSGDLIIDLGPSFLSGSTRAITLEVIAPPNSVCDGFNLDLLPTISADNADPVTSDSAPVNVSDTPPEWEVIINQIALGNPGSTNAQFEVELVPVMSGVNSLSDVTIEVDLPTENSDISYPGICSGCTHAGGILTYNVPSYEAGDKLTFELAFTAGFEDMYDIDAEFTGQYGPEDDLCPDIITDDVTGQFEFDPIYSVACVNGPSLSTEVIGDSGDLSFKFQNTSNVNLSDLTAGLNIPSEIRITEIPAISFPASFGGVDYTITYTSFDGSSGVFPASGTFNTTTGNTSQSVTLPVDDGLASLTFEFSGAILPGFMPNGNLAFTYEVQENDLATGDPVLGANPRIEDGEPCLACLNDVNSTYTCLTASVDIDGVSGIETPTDGCAISTVARTEPAGPYALEKTIGNGDLTYFPGQTATFTLRFQNCGEDPITSALITDDLPEGFAFDPGSVVLTNFPGGSDAVPDVSGLATQGAGGQTLEWDFASLPADPDCSDFYEITYTATVLIGAEAASGLSNCFRVDGQINGAAIEVCNPNELEDCVDEIRILPVGPVPVAKSVDRAVKFPGEEVTFRLRWRVNGPFTVTSMDVSDVLPPELAFVPGSVEYSDNLYSNGDGTGTLLGTFGQVGTTQTLEGTFMDVSGADPSSADYIITYKAKVRTDFNTYPNLANLPYTLQNCFVIDNVTGVNEPDVVVRSDYPQQRCTNVEIRPPGIVQVQKTSLSASAFDPTDVFEYRIRFRVAGPYAVANVELEDVLPEDVEFIEVSSYSSNVPTTPDPLSVSSSGGITTLIWNWDELPGATGSNINSGFYTIVYQVRIRPGTPVGDYQNCGVIGDGAVPLQVDIDNENFDLSDFIAETNFSTENCAVINVLQGTSADSRKGVKGECDIEFLYRDPTVAGSGIGSTFSGGSFTYRLEITNTGNVALNNLVIADILPYLNDDGVLALQQRESEWRPVFAGEVMPKHIDVNGIETTVPSSEVTAYYSFETDPCPDFFTQSNGDPFVAPGCTGPVFYTDPTNTMPAFVDVLPEVRTQIQTIRLDFDKTLAPRESFVILIEMQAPIGTTAADGIAWNNFAFQADPEGGLFLPAAEPIKVGIQVKDNPAGQASLGNFVWLDENDDGLQTGEEDLGINDVRVRLYRVVGNKDGDGNTETDDELLGTRYTADDVNMNPGYYLFSDLNPDDYYVVFDEFPTGLMVVNQDAGANDAIDSDGNAMGMSDIITLAAGDENLTVDQGLNPPPNCFEEPIIRVACLDNGTPGDPSDDQFEVYVTVNSDPNNDAGSTYFVVTRQVGAGDDVLENDLGLPYNQEVFLGGPYDIWDDGSLNELTLFFQAETNRLCTDEILVRPPATLELTNLNLTDCVDDGGGDINYDLSVNLNVGPGMIPANSQVVVTVQDGGVPVNQTVVVTEDQTYPITFEDLACSGENNLRVTATFATIGSTTSLPDVCAAISARYDEPCYVDIKDVIITDNCRTNGTYDIEVVGTIFNAGDINITINNDGLVLASGSSLSKNLADGADKTIFTRSGIQCDGRPHTVSVTTTNGGCMDQIDFEGPRDRDYGDLPRGNQMGVNYTFPVTNANNGAYHLIYDDIFLGDCVDSEIDGAPEFTAGRDANGDDNNPYNNPGEALFSECAQDDEDGITLLTPLVPGNEAQIEVRAVVPTSGANLSAWIDFNGNGSFQPSEKLTFTERDNVAITNSQNGFIPSNGTYIFSFNVPTNATIGTAFPDLRTHMRYRLRSSSQNLNANGRALDGEVEDYYQQFAKLGDFVWFDLNKNGIQDAGEPGIPGVELTLTATIDGVPFTATTTTDNNGMYMFPGLLPDETYTITVTQPNNYQATPGETNIETGDPANDSDADPTTGMTGTVTLVAGENEPDVDFGFYRFDYGDLPTGYPTAEGDGGPEHAVRPDRNIRLGATVDTEADGANSAMADSDGVDEDGFDPTAQMFVVGVGQNLDIPVVNTTGLTAKLTAFIDWNNDGDFDDENEMYSDLVNSGETTATLNNVTPPLGTDINDDLAVRFRFSTDQTAVMNVGGFAEDGEVEDYLIRAIGFDYGDLADGTNGTGEQDYQTLAANNGARHQILTDEVDNVLLKIGDLVDDEGDGQASADADGDDQGVDANQIDDEDGFVPGDYAFETGQATEILVPVMNMTNAEATLTMFVDWNNDGVFDVNTEKYFNTIAANTSEDVTLTVTPPLSTTLNDDLGVRFRLSTNGTQSMSPTGDADDGEVEDYEITVVGYDYGDLADGTAGTGEQDYQTLAANGGPRHQIITNEADEVLLKIGDLLDDEANGQPSADATGDGADEDGFDPADYDFETGQAVNIEIPVMNMTASEATLTMFVDWNNDGIFDVNTEKYFNTIAANTSEDVTMTVTPPLSTTLNDDLGVRFRLSTNGTQSMSPTGDADDGEVEDYEITVVGYDYGDLPDNAIGTSGDPLMPNTPANYETNSNDNGPKHQILTDENNAVTLKIGNAADDEADGQASTTAGDMTDGDDQLGVDDEDGLDLNTIPLFILTQTTTLDIPVMNTTGSDATLTVFLDINKDGAFDPNTEKFTSAAFGDVPTVSVDIPVPANAVVGQDVGLRLRIANDMNEIMTATGLANSGEVEDYLVQIIGFDYGDLPDSYGTLEPGGTDPMDAPRHILNEDLLLGNSVDSELDGNPEPMAGFMQDGDDADPGLVTFGVQDADDEDGIEFITPLVPGNSATIRVQAVNMTGSSATLQMWIDWNGDGDFVDGANVDANEEYSFTVANGLDGTGSTDYTFSVPADAAFREGAAFVRFRLSPNGGLEPDEQTGPVPFGEIEDYKLPVGKIGNLTFEDYNFNGVQDAGEPAINDVEVSLIWFGEDNVPGGNGVNADVTYNSILSGSGSLEDGEYYFCGLTPGEYKLVYTTPTDWTPTRTDQGDQNTADDLDSDGQRDGMNLAMVMETITIPADVTTLPTDENGSGDDSPGTPGNTGNFPDDQTDETHDQGFARLDYGDLPNAGTVVGSDDNFLTTMADGGPVHVIVPGFTLGTTVEPDRDGNPSLGADGDGLEEDGIIFDDPLVPGNPSCIKVTARLPQGETAILQGWIDWNNNGMFDLPDEAITFNTPAGGLISGDIDEAEFCFDVPNALFNDGQVFARFRLSPTGGLGPNGPDKYDPNAVVPAGEIEDYFFPSAKIGNLVFEDYDFDGVQDSNEPGINDVTVTLTWLGEDGLVGGTGVNADVVYGSLVTGPAGGFDPGEYYFCGLIDGVYQLEYTTPENMTPTRTDRLTVGNQDDQDSDGVRDGNNLASVIDEFIILDEAGLPTNENGNGDDSPGNTGTFSDAQVDETHDQGFAFLDYGDLPDDETPGNDPADDFHTRMLDDETPGAVHVVIPDLSLGTAVDGEQEGNPSLDASGDGADEDGIVFSTPLIPGNQACVEVTTRIPDGQPAVLQAWIDWDNNGTLDPDEELNLSGGGAVNADIDAVDYCFDVPADAAFNDGMVFARFRLRLATDPAQGPNGPDKFGADDIIVPAGEVEDYKLNVAKLGNIVFEDYNFNGVQDAGEPGISGVRVTLTWFGADGVEGGGDDESYLALTTADGSGDLDAGEYYFCGLIGDAITPENYKITYETSTVPGGELYTATRTDQGDQTDGGTADSDGLVNMADLTMTMETFAIGDVTMLPTGEGSLGDAGTVGTFPDNQVDETHDQGFARIDYGDLPDDPTDDNDFQTLMEEEGAVQVLYPGFSLGQEIDSELDANPDPSAGLDGNSGDDADGVDDEDGVVFVTPLIPGDSACVAITVNLPADIDQAVVQGWIDWNGNNAFDAGEELNLLDANATAFFSAGAYTFVKNPADNGTAVELTQNVCFDVPNNALFNEGMVYARFRLSPDGGLASGGPSKYDANTNPTGLPIGEVEDHKLNVGKLGNLVWEDYNYDGLQQDEEPGINGVKVVLTWFGPDGIDDNGGNDDVTYDTLTTGMLSPSLGQLAEGQYYFCGLIEGTYQITVITPDDMTPGRTDGGIEDRDSDGIVVGSDLSQVVSGPIVFDPEQGIPTQEGGTTDGGANGVGAFPDDQVDETYDFTFNGIDYGDLPDSYSTLDASNGPKHTIQPGKYLGSCVDGERDGQPEPLAGLFEEGDDGNAGDYQQGTCEEPGDDEDGISFPTPFIPGYEACVEVTYTAEDVGDFLVRDDVFLSAWVDFNGNGLFDTDERLEFLTQDGVDITPSVNVPLAKGTNITTRLCFIVPSDAVYQDDLIRLRFRLNCETDPDNVTPEGLLVGGEVEDYDPPIAKVGNYTWFDNDLNGDQAFTDAPNTGVHADETGVNEVPFVLLWYGEDGQPNTTDDRTYIKTSATGIYGEDEDGIYYFCGLQEGSFEIIPLKYADPSNVFMDEIADEFGNTYDITDPDNITINDGTPTPRYEIGPERKILTRDNDIADDEEDSDGAPNLSFSIPDLVEMGLTTLNEDGNGDLPTVLGYPDTLTNLTLDFGWVQEPNLEVLQRVVGVDVPESGECDHFNVIVDVCMVNSAGTPMNYAMGVPLKDLSLTGDLSAALGDAFVNVVSTQLIGAGTDNNGASADITTLEYDVTPGAPQQYPTLNPNYDGTAANGDLFVDNTGFIWPGEKVMVRYVIEVNPEAVPMMDGINLMWNLAGSANATNYDMETIPDFFNSGNQFVATDLSSDYTNETGIVLDGTYDDPDKPTNLGDCWKRANEFATFDQVNFSAGANCEVILDETNLIQPYAPECDEAVYPLGGYYRFMVEGTPGIFFEPTEIDAASIVDDLIKYQVFTVNKVCEPRWGELLLEDKTGPVITPPEDVAGLECWLIDEVLNNKATIGALNPLEGLLGEPIVLDGCQGDQLPYTFNDAVEYFQCSEDGVTAVITRTFRSEDDNGYVGTATQTITFKVVDHTEFAFEADTDASDGQTFVEEDGKWVLTLQSCSPAGVEVAPIYPVYTDAFGNEV